MTVAQRSVPASRHSLHSKARALSVILADEFGTPFRFFDADSGEEVSPRDEKEWAGKPCDYETSLVRRAAGEERCQVHSLEDGNYLLILVIFEGSQPLLVAYGLLRGLIGAGPERQREQERLQKWLQTFSDRLRLNDLQVAQRRAAEEQAAQLKKAWELILGLDDAIRRLRVHRDSEKNCRNVLKLARSFLEVQSILWVPLPGGSPPQFDGDPRVALADCQHLAELLSRHADPDGRKPILWNAESASFWSTRFPQIRNLLAFAVSDQGNSGWLIAINKVAGAEATIKKTSAGEEHASFRRTDAATLAPFAALLGLQVRSSRRYQELRGLLVGLTRSLTAALDAKDPTTFGHSERVARIAMELGQELGLQDDELSDIYLAGLLHDIGKIGIPDAMLSKPGPLDAAERERLKQHVTIGYHILAELQPLRHILPGVLYHHERYDGQGYPSGLAGEQIPMLARIMAVADSYDAMSANRPYRSGMEPSEVEATLVKGAGSQWDQRVIEAFLRCRDRLHLIRQRGVGQSLGQALEAALRNDDSARSPSLLLPPNTTR